MNIRKIGFFCIVTLCAVFYFATDSVYAQTYDEHYYFNRARQQMNRGKYVDAITDLNTVLKMNGNNAAAYNMRGVANEKCGKLQEALSDYQNANRLNPDAAEITHNLESLKAKTGFSTPSVSNQYSSPPAQNSDTALSYTNTSPSYTNTAPYYANTAPPASPYGSQSVTKEELANTPQLVRITSSERPPVPVPVPVPVPSYKAEEPKQQAFQAEQNIPKVSFVKDPNAGKKINQNNTQNKENNQSSLSVVDQDTSSHTIKGYRLSTMIAQSSIVYQNVPKNSGRVYAAEIYAKNYIDPAAEKYNDTGVTLCSYGRYSEAIEEFDKAIKLHERYSIAYNNRGAAYALLRNNDKALIDFNQALRLNPYYYDAQYNRKAVKDYLANR
ncbi:MAG: hypothetical protein Ta2G_11170 [Termitinemataceae bacterium]|nr:MAG: hypothetical protein Ta2G_11170 [Termitinemataceae bacterium]